MKPKSPCKKDCPDRGTEKCRPNCRAWDEYEKARNAFYDERGKAYELAYILNEIDRDRYLNLKTHRIRKKRGNK